MIIRQYTPKDCEDLVKLFYHTVHTINAKDYSQEQLNVWATDKIDLEVWNKSLSEHYTVVAVENNIIVGFGDIDKSGYLDRLFVHRDYQRRGIATAICNELERAVKVDKIITYASITAKPFFEQRGFKVVKEQQVERNGIALTNYVMEKQVR
ncbi:MAG: GNAT family N-acetyltransferase [Clostridiales bacterium]|nr:GNAT family N-acetyltransferase [Clostridiales bacterium]